MPPLKKSAPLPHGNHQKPTVTISDEHVAVISITQSTVAFFSEHREIAELLPELLDTFARIMQKSVNASSAKKTTNQILDYFHAFETRNESKLDSKIDSLMEFFDENMQAMGKRVTESVNSLNNDMRQQMLSFVTMIDNAVRASLEKVSADSIASAVGLVVKNFMGEEMIGVRQDNASLHSSIMMELKQLEPRHDHLMSILQNIPNQLNNLFLTSQNDDKDTLKMSLVEIRQKIDQLAKEEIVQQTCVHNVIEGLKHVHSQVDTMWRSVSDTVVGQHSDVRAQLSDIPVLIKGTVHSLIDDIRKEAAEAKAISFGMHAQLIDAKRDVGEQKAATNLLQKTAADVAAKLDTLYNQMTRNSLSNKYKGQNGEDKLYELLCNHLSRHDNFSIEQVTGKAHNCDFVIKCVGRADVRLEAKNHGETTGEKVRVKEVDRFVADLSGLDAHGIFVSINSGICGKGAISFEQLSNGRFAFYLSNNNYDINIIRDILAIIYKMDDQNAKHKSDDDEPGVVRLLPETVRMAEQHLQDYQRNMDSAEQLMKQAVTKMRAVNLDVFLKMLTGGCYSNAFAIPCGPSTPPESESGEFTCVTCNKSCRSKAALMSHMRAHR